MKKTLTLVHLFFLNQVVTAVTVTLIIVVYGIHLFLSEQGAIRERMEPALTREVERLSSDFLILESNVHRLKNIVGLMDVIPANLRLEKFRHIASNTIAPFASQFNAYFALSPDWAKKLFGRDSYVYVVLRDHSLKGTSRFHDPKFLIAEEFLSPGYDRDPEAQWWVINEKNQGLNFSEFYFDKGYMEQVMFSTTMGIYEKNKLQAVVGIDTLASDIASRMSAFQFGKTGGVLIVDQNGRPVLPLIAKDMPIIGFSYRKAISRDDFVKMPKISEKVFNIHGQKLQEFPGMDGRTYVTYAKPVRGRPWNIVLFQEKKEAYSGFYFRLFFFSLLTLAGYALLTVMMWLTGRYVVSQDRRVLAELRESRDKAEAATRAKSSFLSTMSHEIRTPLNAILGSSELLSETNLDRTQRELLQNLHSSGDTLLSMLNNILDVSKLESGRMQMESREFLLSDVVREVEAVIAPGCLRKGLQFQFEGPQFDRWVIGDSLRLKQVLLNLLGNSLKFTDQGTISLIIKASSAQEPNREILYFEVRDTGVGIARENLKKIFDEFGQEDSSVTRRFGGTGLGLSLSQKIVQAMGGELKCESEQNMGSRFSFEVELQSRIAETWNTRFPDIIKKPENKENKETEKIIPALQTPARRILIVDDMEENHTLLRAYLKKVDALEIDSALNGFECLEKWEKDHYDVIFMDVQMPKISGLDTIRRIREMERDQHRKRTPVIVISANSFNEDIEKSLQAGADEHCAKPIRKQAVLELVEKYSGSVAAL